MNSLILFLKDILTVNSEMNILCVLKTAESY
jgi:hypothetical protein